MSRDARPMPAKSLAAMVSAAKEEIYQGNEHWGLIVLVGLFTGFRKRVLVHFTDDWLQETTDGYEVHFAGSEQCTIDDDGGCRKCNDPQTRGQDGFLQAKTGQGDKRTVPIPNTWYDTYNEGKKETELVDLLDMYFRTNDCWGVRRNSVNEIVWQVASRRHEDIKGNHQGEVERVLGNGKMVVPDVQVHDLRASWCAQCLRMGVNDTTLQDWGGWESPEMINHYRSFIGDPTGSEREKVEGEEQDTMTTLDKVEQLQKMGLIEEGEKLSAEELAQFEEILS